MEEGTTRVPPSSPLTKSKGGDKRRLSESSRALTSGEKVVPHYLRASAGSCHDFCKHGKPEGYISDTKNGQPWRRPVSSSGRDSLRAKESEVSAVSKKTVMVPKPSADSKSESFGEETMNQEISSTCENIDMHTEQACENIESDAREEAKTSHGLKTTLLSEENGNQEIPMALEKVAVTVQNASLGTKDSSVSKKSSILTKVKPPSRSPSPIPPRSNNLDGRKSVDGSSTLSKAKPPSRLPSPIPLESNVRGSIDGRKSVEVSSTLSKAKPPSRSPSPIPLGSSIRRSIDGRKSVEGRTSLHGRKAFEGRNSIDERKSVEGKKNMEGKKGIDESVTTILDNVHNSESNGEGSLSADEKKGSERSTSLNSEGNIKDDTFGDGKIDGKTELSKKHVAASKPKILNIKPQPSLIPKISKPPSPPRPSNSTRSKTSDDNQAANKPSTSRVEEKKIGSAKPSANGEEITDAKKVRVVRVVSSVRKPSKIIKVLAKDPIDQGVQEDDTVPANAISKSLIPLAPGVHKSTVRSRISNVPSRLKILPATSEQKILSKSKGVDLKSENQNTLLKARKATLVGENTQLNKRSVKIKVSTGTNAVEKNNSDSFLLRRPSVRRKKNAQVLFNKVIEETARRLVRTSKSKVLALVGAFETVISIQKKSSTTPKAKRVSSTRKPSH